MALYGEWSETEWTEVLAPAMRAAGPGAVAVDVVRHVVNGHYTKYLQTFALCERGTSLRHAASDAQGANLGAFAVPMAALAAELGGGALVLAVEADAPNFRLLQQNAALNRLSSATGGALVPVHAAAAAAEACRCSLISHTV
jgi:hypothetical protein